MARERTQVLDRRKTTRIPLLDDLRGDQTAPLDAPQSAFATRRSGPHGSAMSFDIQASTEPRSPTRGSSAPHTCTLRRPRYEKAAISSWRQERRAQERALLTGPACRSRFTRALRLLDCSFAMRVIASVRQTARCPLGGAARRPSSSSSLTMSIATPSRGRRSKKDGEQRARAECNASDGRAPTVRGALVDAEGDRLIRAHRSGGCSFRRPWSDT